MPEISEAAAAMLFTAGELATLREALMTCHYLASDEEKTLRRQLDLGHVEDEDHRRATEIGRVDAAYRAFRYHLLAERVLAAKPDAEPASSAPGDTPSRPGGVTG